jgi:peptidoglycan/LPS O-acetylase OafA/YrhL
MAMGDPPGPLSAGGPAAASPELAPPRCRADASMEGHHQHRPILAVGDRLVRALVRTTASGEFIPAVNGLRFMAISAVLLHHVTTDYLRVSQRFGDVTSAKQWWEVFPQSPYIAIGYAGHFGVQLFFVISGFVLALPYLRNHDFEAPAPNIWSYYLRRIVRLDPPYIVSLLVIFAFICMTNMVYATDIGWRVLFPHLLASIFYLHGLIYAAPSSISGVAWSLEIEVQFCLLLRLLAKVFVIRPLWLRRILLIALILGWAYAVRDVFAFANEPWMRLSVLKFLQFFLAGFLLADIYAHHRLARSLAGDLLALASAGAIFWILTRNYSLYFLTPILIAAMYAGLFNGKIGYRMITQRWIVITGGMCYSIYLYHYLVLDLLTPLSGRLMDPAHDIGFDLLLQMFDLVPPILIVSAGFYLGIEKPCMRISRSIGRKMSAHRTKSAALASTPLPKQAS